ncbi:MAG: TIGR02996 domain-containing protein [Myxococcota bacterium]|nr:TIGR02996 domain-containing protein [Myxococcota bacterium]
MSVTRDDLLQIIADTPADENAWLLYADWLQQHGEPRGELIALDIALETATERKAELEAARVDLLARYGAAILGETFAKFVASGYGEVVWHRGFITVFGYAGNERVTHLRAVGWLVKLILDNPEPFTFLKKLTLSHTDISDVVPFAQFKHLVEIDVRSTNVRSASVEKLGELRPSLRVRHSQLGT